MSTMKELLIRCSVCKKESSFRVLTSTNTFFGSPDLDTRPPEMKRSTMPLWAQKCPNCGYVSSSVANKTSATKRMLQSEDYVNANGRAFKSELAKKFYQHYLICLNDNKSEEAFRAILHAAWASDDCRDKENSDHCRMLALLRLDKVIERRRGNEDLLLMKCDLLRRSGRFDEVISEFTGRVMKNDLYNKILAFQIERAAAKDRNRYTVRDVEEA